MRVELQPVDGEEMQDKAEVDREGASRGDDARDDGDQQDGVEAGELRKCLLCPGNLAPAERLTHEITHWPYQPWCESCVRA